MTGEDVKQKAIVTLRSHVWNMPSPEAAEEACAEAIAALEPCVVLTAEEAAKNAEALREGQREIRDKAENDRLRAELEACDLKYASQLVENEALREAGEGLYDDLEAFEGEEGVAVNLARWREVAGEPDPIIPGYGGSI